MMTPELLLLLLVYVTAGLLRAACTRRIVSSGVGGAELICQSTKACCKVSPVVETDRWCKL